MKLFKVLLIVICMICLMLATTGCILRSKTEFDFLQENSEISKIELVEIGKLENTDTIVSQGFHTICEIQNTEQFLNDFYNVECRSRFTDPKRPLECTVGIKITYNNDDYEIICSYAQAEYVNGVYSFEKGYHSFDKNQFAELIKGYINTLADTSIS